MPSKPRDGLGAVIPPEAFENDLNMDPNVDSRYPDDYIAGREALSAAIGRARSAASKYLRLYRGLTPKAAEAFRRMPVGTKITTQADAALAVHPDKVPANDILEVEVGEPIAVLTSGSVVEVVAPMRVQVISGQGAVVRTTSTPPQEGGDVPSRFIETGEGLEIVPDRFIETGKGLEIERAN